MKHTGGYFEGKIAFVCFERISRGLKPVFERAIFAIYDKPRRTRSSTK
jgi:hypothetical protein